MTAKQKKLLKKLDEVKALADDLLGNDKHADELIMILSILPTRFKTYFNDFPEAGTDTDNDEDTED